MNRHKSLRTQQIVEEMDYYQGVTDYCEQAIADVGSPNSNADQERIDMLESERRSIYEGLAEYIGAEQSFAFYIKETYPVNNEAGKEILFENGADYVPLAEMLPGDHEELRANGYARMESYDSE